MHISHKSFKELIINTSLNTGSVEVIGSSPILSTIENKEYIRKMIYSLFYSIFLIYLL